MKTLFKSALVLAAFLGMGQAQAQTCELEFHATDDAYTNNSNATRSNTAYGGSSRLHAGVWTWGGALGSEASYINFDVSSLPFDAIVEEATLNLRRDPNRTSFNNANQSNAATVTNITGTWNEATITANNTPSVGTSTVGIPGTSNNDPAAVDVDVKQMVLDMMGANRTRIGMRITSNGTTRYRMQDWASKENSNPDLHPTLTLKVRIKDLFPPIVNTTSSCGTGSASMNVYQNNTGVQYEWFSDPNGVNQISSNRVISVTETQQVWGRYTALDICGTRYASPMVSATINVLPVPDAPQISADASKMCIGESVQLSPDISGGVWSMVNPNTLHTLSNNGLFTSGDQRGVFDVKYTITNSSGCSNSATYQITVGAIEFEIIAPPSICPWTNYGTDDIYIVESFDDPASLANSYHWRIVVGDNGSAISTPSNKPKGIELRSGLVPSAGFIVISAVGEFVCLSGAKSIVERTKEINYFPKPVKPTFSKTENTVSVSPQPGYTYDWEFAPFNLQTGANGSRQSLGFGTSKSTDDVPGWMYIDYYTSDGCMHWTKEWLPPEDPDHVNCDGVRMSTTFKTTGLDIYPNPATDYVSFITNGGAGKANVFSTSGTLVTSIDLAGDSFDHTIDVTVLTAGMYVLQVVSEGTVTESTFMVE